MSTAKDKPPFDVLIGQARIKSSWPSGPGFRSILKDGSGKSYAIPPFSVSIRSRPLYPYVSRLLPRYSRHCHRQPKMASSTSPKVPSRVRTRTRSKTTVKACPIGCLRCTSTPRPSHISTLFRRRLIKPKNGWRRSSRSPSIVYPRWIGMTRRSGLGRPSVTRRSNHAGPPPPRFTFVPSPNLHCSGIACLSLVPFSLLF